MKISVRHAEQKDLIFLLNNDKHIRENILKEKILQNGILVAEADGVLAGWLRYGLFWDEIPFMNMLYVLAEYRRNGIEVPWSENGKRK